MGWLKRLSEGFEEAFATLPPGKTGASENLIKQYFRQRYKIESCRENGEEVDAFELKKYEALQKRMRRKDIDVEKKYQKFKAERKSLPKEKSKALDDAEDIYQEDTENEEVTVFKTVKRGEEIVTKRETQSIRISGAVVVRAVITIPVAACGKRLSSQEQIAGFCAVCDEAVCSEHIRYCAGYNDTPCGKLLCKKHTHNFTEEDGTEQPCCADHYNMRIHLQKNFLESDSEPRKKPKKPEKKSD
jgi:hypothetical protein